MNTDMQLLQEVKAISTKIRNGNPDSGSSYLLGYLWTTLTAEQQEETRISFIEELTKKLEE
jgi:hypothetical protein